MSNDKANAPHAIDLAVLNEYLSTACPNVGHVESADKFAGGQSNPTFKLTTDNGVYVLRRQPPGKLLKSAHAVDREFRVINALQSSEVPVPKAYHLCEDTSIIGSMFYIMAFVEGEIYWNSALPEIETSATRGAMYDEMNRVLAALHSLNIEGAGLSDYGKLGSYFERQLSRWTKQYRASELEHIEEIESLIHYLETNLPEDDGQVSLVHGDFRLDNMMFDMSNTDNPQVVAVLDWELSTLGHPYADLAYQCMQLRLPSDIAHAAGMGGLDRKQLGIPSEKEYIDAYCKRRGIVSIDNWTFYLAFSFFRLAAILQGVVKRAHDGNASSEKAMQLGAMVRPLAQIANQTIHQSE
ncbi:phosphotransferase family protein [Alteromonas sp. ALT199]|uniref:phosphotransferase family protein n=1 Tax=unclassified Alteromonas TaxID=2614992 RepID=UPI001BEC6091|nr:phosphotransferase family protein [Alteromonas sp. ALT199]MBT3134678.1 phosphotransferase family protein [Alteromonas sp. ALT199]